MGHGCCGGRYCCHGGSINVSSHVILMVSSQVGCRSRGWGGEVVAGEDRSWDSPGLATTCPSPVTVVR